MLNMSRRKILIASLAAAALSGLPILSHATDAGKKYDVVVIGGGLAGCSAALEAAQRGKTVALVQVQPMLGGDSYLSTAWFYASNSPLQKRKGIKDSPEQFEKDSLEVAKGKRDPMWTRIVSRMSGDSIEWLEKNGVAFEDVVTASMGSTVKRAIQVKGYGPALMKAMAKALEKTGKVTVMLNTRGTGLIVENGVLKGITYKNAKGEGSLYAPKVILACGGFPFNKELVAKYAPKFAAMGAVGDPHLQGDGLKMAIAQGAQTRNLDIMNIVPTTDKATRIYLTSGALSGGGMLINEKGQRFCNELKSYTDTGLAMLDQKKVFEIMNTGNHSKVAVLASKKVIGKADSIPELAKALGVPEKALAEEIEAHNRSTRGELKDRFGRVVYKIELKAPYYYMEVMPQILQTQGGVVTNDKAQVLGKNNKPILGGCLYAAGDMLSGYLDGGYRTGDALMYGCVSGRVAGEQI